MRSNILGWFHRTWQLALLLALTFGTFGTFGTSDPLFAVGPLGFPESSEPRVAVGKLLRGDGLRTSEGTGEPWRRIEAGEKVFSRDVLVSLPGLRSILTPDSGAINMELWGNLPGLSDSPVLESMIILHDSRAYDLDFSLIRGRVVVTNKKKEGSAKVWLRALTGVQLTLENPGSSVALELWGRWPTGVPFSLKQQPGEGPVRFWEIHVLQGKATLQARSKEYAMEFPGPAYFHGDSVSGPDPAGPQRRATLPSWADSKFTPAAAELIKEVLTSYRDQIKNRAPSEVAEDLLNAARKDKNLARASMVRQLVVNAAAALDEVDRVVNALGNREHGDMRKSAVIALRHWIGVAEGRDAMLYNKLIETHGYTRAQSETILQLLHSPFASEVPETYETLIAYLKHGRVAIRELASWHLYRLVEAGRNIPYDAGAAEADIAKSYEAWKTLIPDGELPPKKK